MKQLGTWLLSIVALMSLTGCLAVSAKHNRFGCEYGVVSVGEGEHVYLVNTVTGEVREIDVSGAKPFVPPHDDED